MSATRFEPTRAALAAALREVDPRAYAATRNHLDGAVTRLSPYITHGMLDTAWLLRWLRRRHGVPPTHKLASEVGWRAYFRHVWRWRGDAIVRSLHAGPLPDEAYAPRVPEDVLQARSGVPAIDQAVRALYRDAWLHNHARLWLASYLIHLRKVHWRAGADWMLAQLLDGDLASNHLSWQWVAGTASSKPYLFDAANVERHAGAAWHSRGTVLDRGRDELEGLAREPVDVGPEPGALKRTCWMPPRPLGEPPAALRMRAPDARSVSGHRVWLIHPWSLRRAPPGRLALAVCDADVHAAWPWSPARWRFVAGAMSGLAELRWFAPAAEIAEALRMATQVETEDHAHLPESWRAWARPAPAAFDEAAGPCRSFSAWWKASWPTAWPRASLSP